MFTSSRPHPVFFCRYRTRFVGVIIAGERYELRLEDKGVSYFRWGLFRPITEETISPLLLITTYRGLYGTRNWNNTFPTNDL